MGHDSANNAKDRPTDLGGSTRTRTTTTGGPLSSQSRVQINKNSINNLPTEKSLRLTSLVVPPVHCKSAVGRHCRDGRLRHTWMRVGSYHHHGRIAKKLHDHADILTYLTEHHGTAMQRTVARWVRLSQKLTRRLAEAPYLVLECSSLHRIGHTSPVNAALVGEVHKDIGSAAGLWAALLVAKDDIHPLMQLAGDKLRLKSLKGRNKTV